MTGRVLTEKEVDAREREFLAFRDHHWWADRYIELIASHRLIQQRLKELEGHHEQFVRTVAQDLNELTQAVRQL